MSETDTIAAISTAPGEGAIAVVRISGPGALSLADTLFKGRARPSEAESHRALHGHFVDPVSGGAMDEVVMTLFREPHSYTGEDMVEISCHGGWVVPRRILEFLIKTGARLATPGEFTQRAFLAGKMDLAQAEAVADLIRAKTDLAQKAALAQLQGTLSKEVNVIREGVLSLLAQVEATLEFPEEEALPLLEREALGTQTCSLSDKITGLFTSFKEGKILREGAKVAIVGKPNVGKSSLFNILLEESKAIVTEVPGTTRDIIEGWFSIKGLPVLLSDTAGIREPGDLIEKEGVLRSKKRIDEADLILLILDSSDELTPEDLAIVEEIRSKPTLAVLSKCDLPLLLTQKQVRQVTGIPVVIGTSAITGKGLGSLKEAIFRILSQSPMPYEQVFVTNVRHARALAQAGEALARTDEALKHGLSEEFLATELREALNALGEITGQTTNEEILSRIFSTFCIGK